MFTPLKRGKEKNRKNRSAPHDDDALCLTRWSFIQFIFSVYPLAQHACRNENGGDFGFLWISIDHIKMMLISTYHLMMFLH